MAMFTKAASIGAVAGVGKAASPVVHMAMAGVRPDSLPIARMRIAQRRDALLGTSLVGAGDVARILARARPLGPAESMLRCGRSRQIFGVNTSANTRFREKIKLLQCNNFAQRIWPRCVNRLWGG